MDSFFRSFVRAVLCFARHYSLQGPSAEHNSLVSFPSLHFQSSFVHVVFVFSIQSACCICRRIQRSPLPRSSIEVRYPQISSHSNAKWGNRRIHIFPLFPSFFMPNFPRNQTCTIPVCSLSPSSAHCLIQKLFRISSVLV